MSSALQWFTAVASSAAGISAVCGVYLQLRKERPRASVESGIVFDGTGKPWQIAITVHCLSNAFTVTGAGLKMEGGSTVRSGTFQPTLLHEGETHNSYILFDTVQAVVSRPMIGLPLFAVAEAAGTTFRGKLDWGVRYALNGELPNDLPSRLKRWTSFLPTPGRRRFRRLLREAKAKQADDVKK